MFDLNGLMGKMKDVQEKMKVAQEKLEQVTHSAESGAGMVSATVNGKKKVLSVKVSDELLNKEDKKTVEDLIVAAVNKALDGIEPAIQNEMKNATGDMNLMNIPGFDLGSLFK